MLRIEDIDANELIAQSLIPRVDFQN